VNRDWLEKDFYAILGVSKMQTMKNLKSLQKITERKFTLT
jgi:hypothetical protein